jgi:hypothetical protein
MAFVGNNGRIGNWLGKSAQFPPLRIIMILPHTVTHFLLVSAVPGTNLWDSIVAKSVAKPGSCNVTVLDICHYCNGNLSDPTYPDS